MDSIAYQQFSMIVPYLFVLFLGFLCGKSKLIDSNTTKTLGFIVMTFFTPFVVLNSLQIEKTSQNSSDLIWAVVASAIIFLLYYAVAFIFFLRKKTDISKIYGCALCSTSASILALPLLSNLSGVNSPVYSAIFLFVSQMLFNILAGKTLYRNKSILKCIITFPFLLGIIAIALYFMNIRLVLPIANTVSCISGIVPALSAFLIGMFFSSFPLSGIKLQFNILAVSSFKLLLFPMLVFLICILFKFPLETTMMYVILAGLPCGIDFACQTSSSQKNYTQNSANIMACTFVFSVISIPMMCYICREIYYMINT